MQEIVCFQIKLVKNLVAVLLTLVLFVPDLCAEKADAKQVQRSTNQNKQELKQPKQSRQDVTKIGPISDPNDLNLLEQRSYARAKEALKQEKDAVQPEQQLIPPLYVGTGEPVRVNTAARFEEIINKAHSAYYEGDRSLLKMANLSGKDAELAELLFDMFSLGPGKQRIDTYRPKFEKLYPRSPEFYKMLGGILDSIGDHEAARACLPFSMHK